MPKPFLQKLFLLICLAATLAAPGVAFAAAGDLLWMQTYNSFGVVDDAYDVAVDSTNNIYWAGRQQTNGGDMFLRKYDVNGNFQWMQTYNSGGTQTDEPHDVAMDSNDNAYVVGYQILPGPNIDMFLRKYDVDGNFQWMRTYDSGSGYDLGSSVGIDSNNNIYIAGTQPTNGGDMFLRKYDVDGNFQWMQAYNSGGTQTDAAYDVTVDSTNSIYMTGRQSTNGGDMLLTKYDIDGNFQWMQTYNSGGVQYDVGFGIAVDSNNNLDIVGYQTVVGSPVILWQYDGGGGSGGGGVDCGLRAYDGASTVTIDCEDPAVSPLRIQKGGTTYGISVVDPADPNASRFRVQTPSGIKALRKQ